MRTMFRSATLVLFLALAGCAGTGKMGTTSNQGGYVAQDEGMPPKLQLGL